MDFEVAGMTELRMNAKAAITGINQLAKRIEEADKKIAQHEGIIADLIQKVEDLNTKNHVMNAKLYEAGVR